MKPRIYRMNWFVRLITFNWPTAITLAPFGIFIKDEYFHDEETRNHESIHWMQQLEAYLVSVILTSIIQVVLLFNGIFAWWILLILIFPPLFYYLWYGVECFIKWITPPRGAYIDLGFEREAYKHELDPNYLKTRKWFAWIKYIENHNNMKATGLSLLIQKKNPKKNAIHYELTTIEEIFNLLTEKNLNKFMRDFKQGMKVSIAFRDLAKAISEAKGIEPSKADLKMTKFTWIDD